MKNYKVESNALIKASLINTDNFVSKVVGGKLAFRHE